MRTAVLAILITTLLLTFGCVGGYCLGDSPFVSQTVYPAPCAQGVEIKPLLPEAPPLRTSDVPESDSFEEAGTSLILPDAIILETVAGGERFQGEKGGLLTICTLRDDQYLVAYRPPGNQPTERVCWLSREAYERLRKRVELAPLMESIETLQEALKGYEATVAKNSRALEDSKRAIGEANAAVQSNEASLGATTEALQKIEARLADLVATIRGR